MKIIKEIVIHILIGVLLFGFVFFAVILATKDLNNSIENLNTSIQELNDTIEEGLIINVE